MRAFARIGNPEPLFEDAPELAGVRVTLALAGAVPSGLLPRQAEFLARMVVGARVSTSEYAKSVGVAPRTALGDLRAMASKGLVRRVGRGKSSRWVRL